MSPSHEWHLAITGLVFSTTTLPHRLRSFSRLIEELVMFKYPYIKRLSKSAESELIKELSITYDFFHLQFAFFNYNQILLSV